MKTLFDAAAVFRKAIRKCKKWKFTGSLENISDQNLPMELYSFFRWVIQGPSNSLSVEKKSNEVHKRAMSLTQSTVSDCLTEQQVKCKTSKTVRLSAETAGCSLRFDGIPFQIVGVKILECQNGPDRNKALKRIEAKKKMQEDVSTSTMQGRVLDQVA